MQWIKTREILCSLLLQKLATAVCFELLLSTIFDMDVTSLVTWNLQHQHHDESAREKELAVPKHYTTHTFIDCCHENMQLQSFLNQVSPVYIDITSVVTSHFLQQHHDEFARERASKVLRCLLRHSDLNFTSLFWCM